MALKLFEHFKWENVAQIKLDVTPYGLNSTRTRSQSSIKQGNDSDLARKKLPRLRFTNSLNPLLSKAMILIAEAENFTTKQLAKSQSSIKQGNDSDIIM